MSTNLYNRLDCFLNDKNDADNIIFKQKNKLSNTNKMYRL